MFAIALLYVYYHYLYTLCHLVTPELVAVAALMLAAGALTGFGYLRDADLAWAAPILANRVASKPMFIFQFALWMTTCSWEREGKLIGTHHPEGPYTYLVRVIDIDDNWKYE